MGSSLSFLIGDKLPQPWTPQGQSQRRGYRVELKEITRLKRTIKMGGNKIKISTIRSRVSFYKEINKWNDFLKKIERKNWVSRKWGGRMPRSRQVGINARIESIFVIKKLKSSSSESGTHSGNRRGRELGK